MSWILLGNFARLRKRLLWRRYSRFVPGCYIHGDSPSWLLPLGSMGCNHITGLQEWQLAGLHSTKSCPGTPSALQDFIWHLPRIHSISGKATYRQFLWAQFNAKAEKNSMQPDTSKMRDFKIGYWQCGIGCRWGLCHFRCPQGTHYPNERRPLHHVSILFCRLPEVFPRQNDHCRNGQKRGQQ